MIIARQQVNQKICEDDDGKYLHYVQCVWSVRVIWLRWLVGIALIPDTFNPMDGYVQLYIGPLCIEMSHTQCRTLMP